MGKEYKGRSFRALRGEDLLPEAPLRADLFVFLPLNGRMFRVRARSQAVSAEALAGYLRAGENLFILDPEKHEGAYDFSDSGEVWNPRLPDELVDRYRTVLSGKEEAHSSELSLGEAGSSQQAAENPEGEILSGKGKEEETGSLLPEKGAASFSLEETETALPEEKTLTSADSSPGEEAGASSGDEALISGASAPEEEARIRGRKNQTEEESRALKPDGSLEEESRRFGGTSEEQEERRIKNKAESDPENRLRSSPEEIEHSSRFKEEEGNALEESPLSESPDAADDSLGKGLKPGPSAREKSAFPSAPDALAEKRIKAEKALEEEGLRFKKDLGTPEEARRVRGEAEILEEELARISPESKAFVEELRRIEQGESEDEEEWNVVPEREGPGSASPEELAAVRLSRALSKKMGELRRELNHAIRSVPKGATAEALRERRKELQEKIDTLERTALLLEALDDEEMEVPDVPELQGLDKAGLLQYLENSLAELKESSLLSEKDHSLMGRKVKRLKEERCSVYGEEVDRLKNRMAAKLEGETALEEEERAALNASLAKEVQAAKTGVKIAATLTTMRNSLAGLLQEKPASPEARKENEKKASELMKGIKKLESMALAVETGEEVDAAALSPFRAEEKDSLRVREGESRAAAGKRLTAELESLRREVVTAKAGAAKAQENLLGKVFGNGSSGEKEALASRMRRGLAEERKLLLLVLEKDPLVDKEKKKVEAEAVQAYARIREMEKILGELGQGDSQALEERWNALAPLPPASNAAEASSHKIEAEVSRAVAQSSYAALRRLAVGTQGLDRAKGTVSQRLEAFRASGKIPDSQEVWEINTELTREVREAKLRTNISREISNLGKELALLQAKVPASEEESRVLEQEKKRIEGDMLRLHGLVRAVAQGEKAEQNELKRFEADLPEIFVFSADKPVPEEVQRIQGGLKEVKEELVKIGMEAMGAMAGVWELSSGPAGSQCEEKTLTELNDPKLLQLGVFAGTFLRAFGYNRADLEYDLMLASFLSNQPREQGKNEIPDRVRALLEPAGAGKAELFLQEASLALRLAREYTEAASIGNFSVDPQLLEPILVYSPGGELRERARRFAERGFFPGEKESLLECARRASGQAERWKPKGAA